MVNAFGSVLASQVRAGPKAQQNLGANMITTFFGRSFKGTPTAELKKVQVESFHQFCEKYLKTCKQGDKVEDYVTIGNAYNTTPGSDRFSNKSYLSKDHYHRNNRSQVSAWLLPFDGDNSVDDPNSCVPPSVAHKSLIKLGYNHVVYTTHSHIPGTKNRFRILIPCAMSSMGQLNASVDYLYRQLKANGCDELAMSTESKTWSVPWFLPTRDDPDDSMFEYYDYHEGRDFIAVEGLPEGKTTSNRGIAGQNTIDDMIEIIRAGISDTGLHEATRNYAHGMINDGVAPATVKATLRGLMAGYDLNDTRQAENFNKIDALVDSAVVKATVESTEPDLWKIVSSKDGRVYTRYPDQGGVMEHLIKACMDWMLYPNRQIAVTAAHALISTLGGRVYDLPTGSGIVLTTLITGRSTIGKSNVKKFCTWALNNFMLGAAASQFIGSHFYTSSKNLVKELQESGSLLSVRTESGQGDKSMAGDMTRVLLYELELATESGSQGYVSSGGQNDKIPALFSPSVTTIRESVAQIQNEADVVNATSVSGVAGRRSHVIIDPIKGPFNHAQLSALPANIKSLILSIYKMASDERRKNIEEPMSPDLWVKIDYKDPSLNQYKLEEWRAIENEAAKADNHFKSTFYGRLGQRVPAYAARLAICDNPVSPVITAEHMSIAEASLIAEFEAHHGQQMSGALEDPWSATARKIKELFMGDMEANKLLNSGTRNKQLLRDGCASWTAISHCIRYLDCLKIIKKTPNYRYYLTQRLEEEGIVVLDKKTAREIYHAGGIVLKRG